MVNKVILVGNVGADPEVKAVGESKVANLTLATSETYKDKQGEKKTVTEWHRLVIWRGLAEIVEKYVKNGASLYVEGKLQTRSWEDKDGNKKFTTEIVVDTLKMLGGGQKKEESSIHMPPDESLEPTGEELPF